MVKYQIVSDVNSTQEPYIISDHIYHHHSGKVELQALSFSSILT